MRRADCARFVDLRSGRLPGRCGAAACEVLQVGGSGRRLLREGEIRLVRVGIGKLRDVIRLAEEI